MEPHLPTLLFLQHSNRPIFQEAINTHSDGIVLEQQMGSGHVVEALRRVSNGGMYLEPLIAAMLSGSQQDHIPGLTSRELEVMQHVVCGLNDREIGIALQIATDTVKYRLKQVYSKLGIHNRTRAAISLILMGLVPPPAPLIPDRTDQAHMSGKANRVARPLRERPCGGEQATPRLASTVVRLGGRNPS